MIDTQTANLNPPVSSRDESQDSTRILRASQGFPLAIFRDGGLRVLQPEAFRVYRLADLVAADPLAPLRAPVPRGGRIAAIAYEMGALIEPASGPVPDPRQPLLVVADAESERAVGGGDAEPSTLGPLTGAGAPHYERSVERALEYIRAGDVYQVNLTHPLEAGFESSFGGRSGGTPRSLFARVLQELDPIHGGYIEFEDQAIVSASPELFLRYDASTRRITTRPMKGTRPATADPRELEASEKDRAELTMIVDLMRNDLGRVCRTGSMRVEIPRQIERHASGVLQATATVSGTLSPRHSFVDAFTAAFPPGSVTGAPKIRAMQIINELEASPRGFYCGAMVHMKPSGDATASVLIRTATIRDGVLVYPVGAGIVADSEPHAEWRETLLKAEGFRRLESDRT